MDLSRSLLLGSGSYFDFDNPEIFTLSIEDVAYALSFCARFLGHCCRPLDGRRLFYSVAEHCVRMSFIVPEEHAYAALMHEIGEAVCGDIPGPLKKICPEIKLIEKRCEAAGRKAFFVGNYDANVIKRFDGVMLVTERRDLMAWDGQPWAVAEEEPLVDLIVPWSSQTAAWKFLMRYSELKPAAAPSPQLITDHQVGD